MAAAPAGEELGMSEPIADFRDSVGVDRTAMFDPSAHLLFGLVGAEYIGLHPKIGSLHVRVFLPRHKIRAPTDWRPK